MLLHMALPCDVQDQVGVLGVRVVLGVHFVTPVAHADQRRRDVVVYLDVYLETVRMVMKLFISCRSETVTFTHATCIGITHPLHTNTMLETYTGITDSYHSVLPAWIPAVVTNPILHVTTGCHCAHYRNPSYNTPLSSVSSPYLGLRQNHHADQVDPECGPQRGVSQELRSLSDSEENRDNEPPDISERKEGSWDIEDTS